jgi:hypothetical protein
MQADIYFCSADGVARVNRSKIVRSAIERLARGDEAAQHLPTGRLVAFRKMPVMDSESRSDSEQSVHAE